MGLAYSRWSLVSCVQAAPRVATCNYLAPMLGSTGILGVKEAPDSHLVELGTG